MGTNNSKYIMKKFKDILKKEVDSHKKVLAAFKSAGGYIVYDFAEHVMVKFDSQASFRKLEKLISRVGNQHDFNWSEGDNVLKDAHDFYVETGDEFFLSSFEDCIRVIKNRKPIRDSDLEPLFGMRYHSSSERHALNVRIGELLAKHDVFLTG